MVHFGYRLWQSDKHNSERLRPKNVEGDDILLEYAGPMSGISQNALNHYYKGEFI